MNLTVTFYCTEKNGQSKSYHRHRAVSRYCHRFSIFLADSSPKTAIAEQQAKQSQNVTSLGQNSQGQNNQAQNNEVIPSPSKSGAVNLPSGGQVRATLSEQPGMTPLLARSIALANSQRILIDTPNILGSIALKGGMIDDVTLKAYHQTVDRESPQINFLNPNGTENEYFVDFGWTTTQADVELPDRNTIWSADNHAILQPGLNVTLTWQNKQKILFKRTYEIDSDFMLTVTQEVVNNSDQKVEIYPYSLASHRNRPQTLGYFILHEGFVGWMNDRLREHKYTDLDNSNNITEETNGGWFGLTDKYFYWP